MNSYWSRKDWVTAGTLINKLEKDAQFVQQQEEKDKLRKSRIIENGKAAAPVLDDLSRAGFVVDSIADLYNQRYTYKKVIPLLLKWLPHVTNQAVKEDIIRALSVRWAKPIAAPILVREFLQSQDLSPVGIKWTIGNALEVVADDSVFASLVEIAQNKKHGKAREMVVVALGNMRNVSAVDVLIDLLDDEEVAGHALIAIGKLKAGKAVPYIKRFLTHPKPWVRQEAKRALARIEKSQ